MSEKQIKKVGIIIVTFNPDVDLLVQNLRELMFNELTEIIVINNGAGLELPLDMGEKTHVLNLNDNLGIALAQNKGIELAHELQVDFITFFDQDSKIPEGFLETLVEDWGKLELMYDKLGMVVPAYYDRNLKRVESFAIFQGGHFNRGFIPENDWQMPVSMPISSGSLVSLKAIEEVGLFRSDYFIDWVDSEYDLRLIQAGFDIVAVNNVVLDHSVGRKEARKFLGRTFYPSNHAPFRLYYYMRNGMWTWKLYGKELPDFWRVYFKTFFGKLFFAVMFEDRKIKRIGYIFKGLLDGIVVHPKKNSEIS